MFYLLNQLSSNVLDKLSETLNCSQTNLFTHSEEAIYNGDISMLINYRQK